MLADLSIVIAVAIFNRLDLGSGPLTSVGPMEGSWSHGDCGFVALHPEEILELHAPRISASGTCAIEDAC